MPAFWLIGLQVAAAWSPPAQAAWPGDAPPVDVALKIGTLSMREIAPIEVDLVAHGDGLRCRPFCKPRAV